MANLNYNASEFGHSHQSVIEQDTQSTIFCLSENFISQHACYKSWYIWYACNIWRITNVHWL